MHRTFLLVSDGRWQLSSRKLVGAAAETVTDWLVNITSPLGDRYAFVPPVASDSVTFVDYTSAVLLSRPMSPAAVSLFEASLADALKPLLGESHTHRHTRGVVVSGVRRMNEVNARRARLVLGWMTVFGGRVYRLGM